MDGVITAPAPLTEARLLVAVRKLAAADPALGAVVDRFGTPPMWAREPGFPTLVHLILEQQVSLASAQAAFDRLRLAADPLTPSSFLRLDDAELLAVGFSRQKTRYARALATAVDDGSLDIEGLAALDDDDVDAALTALPGIGPWTATIYRLMVLLRPDAWPVHDIALAQALAELRGLDASAGRGADARARRGVAAAAGGRRPDPVAPLPLDAAPAGQSRTMKASMSTRPSPTGRTSIVCGPPVASDAPEHDPPVAVARGREVDGRDQHAVDADLRVAAVR